MQRIALIFMATAAMVLGIFATVATARSSAAVPTCGDPPPVTAHEEAPNFFWLGTACPAEDPEQLTFEIVTGPEHGDLTGPDAFGGVVYLPDAAYIGDDAFEFRVSDGDGQSGTLTMAITVVPNQPPECEDSAIEVEPDMANWLWIYCFDPDVVGETTYTIVDPPQHGTVEIDPFEGVKYTPASGYRGPDSFSYKANDGWDDSNVATVSITVLHPNRVPVCATPLTLRVPIDGSAPLDPTVACTDPDGDPISPSLVAGPYNGSLTFVNGVITYSPDAGYAGPDRIEYVVSDDRGGQSAKAVLKIIVGDEPPPVEPAGKMPGPDTVAPGVSMVVKPGQRLRDVRTKGLKLIVASSEPARVLVRLTVSKATARRLELKRKPKARVAVGSGDRRIRAGSTTVSVSLTDTARKALRRVRKVKLLASAVATDAAGNGTVVSRAVRLRRK